MPDQYRDEYKPNETVQKVQESPETPELGALVIKETKSDESLPMLGFSLDIDGATLLEGVDEINPQLLVWLVRQILQAWQEFEKIFQGRILTVVLLSGSLRQTFGCEWSNHVHSKRYVKAIAAGLKSSVHVLLRIAQYLNEHLNEPGKLQRVEIICEKLLMADLQGMLNFESLKASGQIGREWTAILNNECEAERVWHDPSKISLLYTQMQYLGSTYPERPITFHFLDDRTDILQTIGLFYHTFPQFVPDTVFLFAQRCLFTILEMPLTAQSPCLQVSQSKRHCPVSSDFPALQEHLRHCVEGFLELQGEHITRLKIDDPKPFLQRLAVLVSLSSELTPACLYRCMLQLALCHLEHKGEKSDKQERLRELLRDFPDEVNGDDLSDAQGALMIRRDFFCFKIPDSWRLVTPLYRALQQRLEAASDVDLVEVSCDG